MDAISLLEKKLKKSKVTERARILEGVYKQLTTSRRKKHTNDEYRNALTTDELNVLPLVNYVERQLQKYGLNNHAKRLFLQYGCPIDLKRIKDPTKVRASLIDIKEDLDRKQHYRTELVIPFTSAPTRKEVIAIGQALAVFINNRSTKRQMLHDGPNQYSNNDFNTWSILIRDAPASPKALCDSSYTVCGKGPLAHPTLKNSIYIHGLWFPNKSAHPKETLELFAATIRGE